MAPDQRVARAGDLSSEENKCFPSNSIFDYNGAICTLTKRLGRKEGVCYLAIIASHPRGQLLRFWTSTVYITCLVRSSPKYLLINSHFVRTTGCPTSRSARDEEDKIRLSTPRPTNRSTLIMKSAEDQRHRQQRTK